MACEADQKKDDEKIHFLAKVPLVFSRLAIAEPPQRKAPWNDIIVTGSRDAKSTHQLIALG